MGAAIAGGAVLGAGAAAVSGLILHGSKGTMDTSQTAINQIINTSLVKDIQKDNLTTTVGVSPNQSINIQGINGGKVLCNPDINQTLTEMLTIKTENNQQLEASVTNSVNNSVNALLESQQKAINGFLSSLDKSERLSAKQTIDNMFSNAITQVFSETSASAIAIATNPGQGVNILAIGKGSTIGTYGETCPITQTIVLDVFATNVTTQILNAITADSTNNDILEKFYAYQYNNSGGIFGSWTTIVIVIIIIIVVLFLLALLFHFIRKNRTDED